MNERAPQANPTPRRIQLSETQSFTRDGFDGHEYIAKSEGLGLTALAVDVHGTHPRKRMLGDTTRTYFVLEGTRTFILGDKSYEVIPGDCFTIPPDGEYEYSGLMRLLEVNVSPTNEFRDEKLQ